MRTENAIDLFGSHWETELVPPDDAADQLDITNYRVVAIQKLGSGRRRPLVANEVAEDAAIQLVIQNIQIGTFLVKRIEQLETAVSGPVARLGDRLRGLPVRQEIERLRQLLRIHHQYDDLILIEKEVGTTFRLEERPLGETVACRMSYTERMARTSRSISSSTQIPKDGNSPRWWSWASPGRS